MGKNIAHFCVNESIYFRKQCDADKFIEASNGCVFNKVADAYALARKIENPLYNEGWLVDVFCGKSYQYTSKVLHACRNDRWTYFLEHDDIPQRESFLKKSAKKIPTNRKEAEDWYSEDGARTVRNMWKKGKVLLILAPPGLCDWSYYTVHPKAPVFAKTTWFFFKSENLWKYFINDVIDRWESDHLGDKEVTCK